MSNFTYFNRSKVCPVCGQGNKKCAQAEDTGYIFCGSQNQRDTHDYKFLKPSRDGLWGIYKLLSEYKENKKQKGYSRTLPDPAYLELKRKRQEAEKNRLNSLLTAKERDKKFTNLFASLVLSSEHKQDILSRIKKPAVSQLGVTSIKKYSTFDLDLQGIPGFAWDEKAKAYKYYGLSGIICPCKNAKGEIIGYQIKADDPGNLGKYVWTKTKQEKTSSGFAVSAHLRNGELPLNVAKGDKQDFIGICEGILKPHIASLIHGRTFIGGSGGHFGINQLKEYLQQLNPHRQIPVVVFPDAGVLKNKHVVNSTARLIGQLQQLGYDPKIADWGQWLNKESGKDCDEIFELDNVHFRDTEDYEYYIDNTGEYSPEINLSTYLVRFGLPKFLGEIVNRIPSLPKKKIINRSSTQQLEWFTFDGLLPPDRMTPNIEFKGLATDLYSQISRLGKYKYALDISETGAGKTTAAADLDPDQCFIHPAPGKKPKFFQQFYLTTSSRNPAVSRLEEYQEVPVRSNGWDFHETKKTPSGKPVRVYTKDPFKADVVGNCHLSEVFLSFRDHNLSANPCRKCQYKKICPSSSGDGFGYQNEIKEAVKAKRLIANPISLTKSMVDDKTLVIVDEYSRTIEWTNKIEVTIDNLRDSYLVLLEFARNDDEFSLAANELLEFVMQLEKLLRGESPRFGRQTKELISSLPPLPNYELIQPLITKLEEEAEKTANRLVSKLSGRQNDAGDNQGTLIKNWYTPFFIAAARQNPNTSLWQMGEKIVIFEKNERILEALNKAHLVIFQDATGSREDLASKLGCKPEEICLVRHVESKRDNVIVKQVTGFGVAGKNRRESLQKRLDLLRNHLEKEYGETIGFIDYKAFSKPGDLVHFSDARGSNKFQSKRAVASFGIPCPSVAATLAQYEVESGQLSSQDDRKFQEYLNQIISAEIIQEIGRLRANRRKDETLHYYLCGDADVSFLQKMGFRVEQVDAVEICPQAATKRSKARKVLINAYQALIGQGKQISDITQQELADSTDYSQPQIAYLAKTVGGWQELKRIVGCLLKGKSDYEADLGELSEKAVMAAYCYLPEAFSQGLENAANLLAQLKKELPSQEFEAVLQSLSLNTISEFLSQILAWLPAQQRKIFDPLSKRIKLPQI